MAVTKAADAQEQALTDYVRRMVDTWPPLSSAQRDQIAALLHRRRRPKPAR